MKRQLLIFTLFTFINIPSISAQSEIDSVNFKQKFEEIIVESKYKIGFSHYWSINKTNNFFLYDTVTLELIEHSNISSDVGNMFYKFKNDTIINDSLNWFTFKVLDSIELVSIGNKTILNLNHSNTDYFLIMQHYWE